MRVLHLLYESKDDYFGIGGVGIRAYEIYKRLRDRHDITLLCKKYPGAKNGEKENLGHIFVGVESKSLTKTLLAYAYHAAQYVKRHENEYDIIIEDFSPAIPTFLHVLTRKTTVLQVQGYTGKLYFRKYNPLYAMTLFLMERLRPLFYDNFIFISSETARKVSVGGKKHVAIIPNGVPPELLATALYDGEYILYLGRIDIFGKGLDLLVKAYKELHVRFPDIHLVIAGDGRDREAFKAELMSLPHETGKNIELLGWVTGERKAEVIRRARICVFPSRQEVQPIAALEVMACGKPLIVSDIPEFGFVRDNGAGTAFKKGDASSLARSMEDLLTNNGLKEMGKRGRQLVKELSWDRVAMKYENVLYEVAERKG